jgi:hypothetical protein
VGAVLEEGERAAAIMAPQWIARASAAPSSAAPRICP